MKTITTIAISAIIFLGVGLLQTANMDSSLDFTIEKDGILTGVDFTKNSSKLGGLQ